MSWLKNQIDVSGIWEIFFLKTPYVTLYLNEFQSYNLKEFGPFVPYHSVSAED